MRRVHLTMLGAVVVVTAAACAMPPKVDMAAETAALRARSDGLQAAEGAMDREKSLTFWSKDAIIQPAGTPQVAGHDAISALYKSYFEGGMLKALAGTASQLTLSSGGDMAYEVGINRMTLKGPKGDLLDVGKYLLVWRKEAGVWNVVALSFTSDAAEPVPVAAAKK